LVAQARGNRRPDTVSADERDTTLVEHLPTAPAEHAHAPHMGGKFLDPRAQFKRHVKGGVRRIDKRRLQVSAVDGPVWRTVATLAFVPQGKTRNLASRAASHNADSQRFDGSRFNSVAQAQRDQYAAGIR